MGAVHSIETVLPEKHRLTNRKFVHDQFKTERSSPQEIRVMTYNVRYDNPDDAKDGWPNRKLLVKDVVVHHRPDIVGFQECLPHQHKFLETELLPFKYCQYGLARECNSDRNQFWGESSPIFWNNERYEAHDCETIWLNEKCQVGAKGWDAACHRVCTVVRLIDRQSIISGDKPPKSLLVMNTHFDHVSGIARCKSAELIRKRIESSRRVGEAVIFMGDLNCFPDGTECNILTQSQNPQYCLADALKLSPPNQTFVRPSFQGFTSNPHMMIDHVFVSPDVLNVHAAVVLREQFDDGRQSSDHDPIIVVLTRK